MTKILLVTLDFPPMVGGISTHLYLLAKNLGRKVTVLAPSCKGIEKFDGAQKFRTIRMKLSTPGKESLLFNICLLTALAFYVLYYVTKLRPNKIYLTHWNTAIPTLPASKLLKIPYYLEVHGSEVVKPMRNKLYKVLLNLCVQNAREIICLGGYQKRSLAKEGMPLNKLRVVNVGADLDLFRPDIDPSEIIEKYRLKDKKVILTVGRLVKRKGHDIVIKSLPNVLARIPNVVYVIVGEGPELENLKALVRELNLGENVIFAGYVNSRNLPKFYNACDLFVMASREVDGDIEGFGIVYLEANACGKPVIAGRSGGTESAVRDKINGLLVDPLNIEEISKQIALLLTDRKLAKDMGWEGRRLVEKKFNYRLIAKKILDIIEERG